MPALFHTSAHKVRLILAGTAVWCIAAFTPVRAAAQTPVALPPEEQAVLDRALSHPAAQTTAAPSPALTPEDQAVLASFQGVLDGIGKRDPALIREQLLPGGMATLLRNGQAVQLHFDAFVAHIHPGPEKYEERIHDPLIRIDDDIAIIWAPYDFLVNGKVEHCGTDVVNLLRHDGRWLISGIADNSHNSCPAGK
jgi:hypothetical protein